MSTPGVVYTRDWAVDLVLDVAGYTADKELASSCIIEPACGDGAFLARIVDRLCESASRGGRLVASRLGKSVRAYDLDPKAVDASRAVVADALRRNGASARSANTLSRAWVSQGDFLMSDLPAARWVVGNPPYVRASMLPRRMREKYASRLQTVTMGSDLYVGFFEKGLRALTNDGSLCFICADRWLQNRYGTRLRAFVSDGYSLDAHVRMHGVDAFEDDVSAYPAISLVRPGAGRDLRYVECEPSFGAADAEDVLSWLRDGAETVHRRFTCASLPALRGGDPIPLASAERLSVYADIESRFPTLGEAGVSTGIGVATGCDEVFITEDDGVVEGDRLLPLFVMRDERGGGEAPAKWLVNPWGADGSLVELEDYPRLKDYLKRNEERLRRRRVARDHPDSWYRTLDKPRQSLIGREMLLFPDMSAKADPVYSDGSKYPHHNCYWMTSDEWDLDSLGGLMMSDVVEGCVDAYGVKMRGSTLRFQAQFLRRVHVPRASDVDDATKRELAAAFEAGDRERASAASRRAYGLGGSHEG